MRVIKILLPFLVLLPVASHSADDGGLYAPPPPADAAYVRIIGSEASVTLGKTALKGDKTAGTYSLVTQGKYTVNETTVEPKAGHFYSLITTPEVKLLQDPTSDNPAKATLVFYNLTTKAGLSLKSGDGKVEVVSATAPNALGHRIVNAIEIGFALYDGKTKVAWVAKGQLERGQGYSLLAQERGNKLVLTLVKNSVATPD